MSDYEQSFSALSELIAVRDGMGTDANEATTRLQIIDSLLFDCLGWEREDCIAEEQFEGAYTDYALGRPARKLVVEAKREGVHFELAGSTAAGRRSLTTLARGSESFAKALAQTLSYCQSRGVPIGAVCNGHQLVVFIGSRGDNVHPSEGQAWIFDLLQGMLDDFPTLWRLLSKPGVHSGDVYECLGVAPPVLPPDKLSSRISGYPGYQRRNQLATDLKVLGDLVLQDLVRDLNLRDEFLRACYCSSGALSQYASISRSLLAARSSAIASGSDLGITAEPAVERRGINPAVLSDLTAATFGQRPVILLGEVGVGKSMFIQHFIGVDAKEVLDASVTLLVDFGASPALADDINVHVLNDIDRQLLDDYGIDTQEDRFVRGVYNGELNRFARGIYAGLRDSNPERYAEVELEFLAGKLADRSDHMRSSLRQIVSSHRRQVVIFLDNVDQRPYEFQEKVFLIAQTLAETWPAAVFVSLRPETFYKSRAQGALSAYQPRVFTVAPPRVDEVLLKRLEFASAQLHDDGRLGALGEGISLHADSLNNYFIAILHSLRHSSPLIEIIDNLSSGNVRQGLAFLSAFVGSGHVDSEKILRIVEEQGYYTVAVHEFLRAIIFGDYRYYDPSASPVANLFDISTINGREHFLLAICLRWCERNGIVGGGDGFVRPDDLYDFTQRLAFTEPQIAYALERATRWELLEASFSYASPDTGAQFLRITTAGAYAAKSLIQTFAYVDAVIVDTPIIDSEVRSQIVDVLPISARLARGELFIAYLDAQWDDVLEASGMLEWSSIRAAITLEIARVRTRL